jgi:hypothetical protein
MCTPNNALALIVRLSSDTVENAGSHYLLNGILGQIINAFALQVAKVNIL